MISRRHNETRDVSRFPARRPTSCAKRADSSTFWRFGCPPTDERVRRWSALEQEKGHYAGNTCIPQSSAVRPGEISPPLLLTTDLSPGQNRSSIPSWMFRGAVTDPFHCPKLGLATSELKAVEPKQVSTQFSTCQFQILKNSPRNCRVTLSVRGVFLIKPKSWLW